MVEFPDGLGGERIVENTFSGPLYQQLRNALRYLSNTVATEHVIKCPDRAEADRYTSYPYPALEEALSNAVYHSARASGASPCAELPRMP